MTGIWLANDDGDLVDLADIEPWRYSVEGKPVTRIEYRYNAVTIEWASQDELDKMREWFDE